MISGLDIRYDLGDGHPPVGRRMPDLDLFTCAGPQRFFTALHDVQAVLLNFDRSNRLGTGAWADRVRRIDALYAGRWELPVVGSVPSPAAVLVRPDGYVAWAGDTTGLGLREALTRWFGEPRPERESR
jgi:hypothetical protein